MLYFVFDYSLIFCPMTTDLPVSWRKRPVVDHYRQRIQHSVRLLFLPFFFFLTQPLVFLLCNVHLALYSLLSPYYLCLPFATTTIWCLPPKTSNMALRDLRSCLALLFAHTCANPLAQWCSISFWNYTACHFVDWSDFCFYPLDSKGFLRKKIPSGESTCNWCTRTWAITHWPVTDWLTCPVRMNSKPCPGQNWWINC